MVETRGERRKLRRRMETVDVDGGIVDSVDVYENANEFGILCKTTVPASAIICHDVPGVNMAK